jgi:hypothetical protein
MVNRRLIETLGVTASFGTLELFVGEMESQVYRHLGTERRYVDEAREEPGRTLAIWRYNLVATTFPRRFYYGVIRGDVRDDRGNARQAVRSCSNSDAGAVLGARAFGLRAPVLSTYLRRTLGLDVSTRSGWAEVLQIAQVRHCVAHVGGHVATARKPAKLKAALTALGLSVDGDGYIDIPHGEAVRLIIEHAKCWIIEVVSDADRALPPAAGGGNT